MRLQDRLIPGVRIPSLAIASAAALVITAFVVIGGLLGVLGASFESGVEADDANVVDKLLASNSLLVTSEDRFTGRSIFYIPKAPRLPAPPPPPPPPPVVTERPAPPPPPPPSIPSTYGGPDVTGILGMDVFFDNGKRIPEGSESDGVEVIEIESPFNVRLGWRGGTFTVSLFSEELPEFFTEPPFANGGPSDLLTLEVAPANEAVTPRAPTRPRPGSSGAIPGPNSRTTVEVPEPLTQDALEKMDRMQAIQTLTQINSALRLPDLDSETQERLGEERLMIQERIRAMNNG